MLSHLFEQYFNHTAGATMQDRVAEGLMKTDIQYGPIAVQETENYEARANLLGTSTLALNGLVGRGRNGGWTCHPIEHELSAYYDITHGIGLAILTPRWMKYCVDNDSRTHGKFATYAREIWKLSKGSDEELARQAVKLTYEFYRKDLEIPMTLPEVGIETKDLVEEMSRQAVLHGGLLEDKFVNLDEKAVAEIINASFEDMTSF